MEIRVNPHTVEIVKEQTEPINELEIKVSKCKFEFDEAITSDFVKEAYFTLNGETYKQIIVNNECDYPSEVLAEKGTLEIGVVAFKVENSEEIVRYNPSPDYFESWVGSLKEANNSEPITPTDKEQIEQAIANLEVDKQDKLIDGDNITIEDNVISAVDTIYDDSEIRADISELENSKVDKVQGKGLSTNDYTTDEKNKLAGLSNYDDTQIRGDISQLATTKANKSEIPDVSYFITRSVDNLLNYYLKSETYTKAEVNQLISATTGVRFELVNELPITGESNVIYLIPSSNPETRNVKDEFIWINNAWEQIGSTSIDLSDYVTVSQLEDTLEDYVKKTDYATANKGGVIKINSPQGTGIYSSGVMYALTRDYSTYQNDSNDLFIGKGTLENVIIGKELVNKTYVDDLAGDIPTSLADLSDDTTHRVVSDTEKQNWNNKSNFSGNYNDLTNKPTIPTVPTNVSAFTNDAGYLTQHQDISGKLDTSKVKTTSSTTAGDVYDVRYINTMLGDIETLLGGI